MPIHRSSLAGFSVALLAISQVLSSCSSPAGNADRSAPAAAAPTGSPLQVVAEFTDPQMVGVAVAPGGKIIACFPRWNYNPAYPVAVVGPHNTLTPYPDAGSASTPPPRPNPVRSSKPPATPCWTWKANRPASTPTASP